MDIGNKAHSIKLLQRYGFRIPPSWVIPSLCKNLYQEEGEKILEQLKDEFQSRLKQDVLYAVRSSASIEDGSNHSCAGQFQTVLNVSGPPALSGAVEQIWQSAEQVKTSDYGKVLTGEIQSSEMSVVVQEMVDALWSGVCFSIYPVSGRNEFIIEGVKGSGELLVQQGSKPFRWIFAQGAFVDSPEGSSPGKEVLNELIESVDKLRKLWGKEVDVEWAFDGEELYYLQCRAVTARKYPIIFSNRLSREFLPGMIKPMVWSINIPVVNSAWIRLLESMLGPMGLKPEQLSHSFYYRAYFNMGTMGALFRELGFPRDSLERLLGRENPSGKSPFRPGVRTLRYIPRMLWFFLANLWLGKKFRRWMGKDDRNDKHLRKELLEDFHIERYPYLLERLMHRSKEAAYYNIVIPLGMHLTNRLLKRKLDRKGVSLESLDFFSDFPVLREYDPQYELRRLHELWKDIPGELHEGVKRYSDLRAHRSCKEVESFYQAFDIFMSSFGHFSESGNDLSYPHWNEDPDFVLKLIRKSEAKNDSEYQDKQSKSLAGRKSARARAYKRAGKFRVYREMISSLYTREYGFFRILFQQCGLYLVNGGYIEQQNDVFYLTLEELNELLHKGEDLQHVPASLRITERKQEMAEYEDLTMPSIIYGEVPPPIARKGEEVFQGIPTSSGQFEGKIVVVKGYEDFDKDVADKILVIPFADVGWTPLLVKAGAIVSESGGMLSHAAIVSRELSIPSISSVDHACQIQDGTLAKLDGSNGSLILKN